MTPQKQLYRHDPTNGQWGDCHRTAIACLLDIPVQESPHFIGQFEQKFPEGSKDRPSNSWWQDRQEKFLNDRGYTSVSVAWDGATELSAILNFFEVVNPGRYYIMGGRSPRGTNHSVIGCGGELVWDPHPDGGFLVGPMDNNSWQIDFILPVSMKAGKPPNTRIGSTLHAAIAIDKALEGGLDEFGPLFRPVKDMMQEWRRATTLIQALKEKNSSLEKKVERLQRFKNSVKQGAHGV